MSLVGAVPAVALDGGWTKKRVVEKLNSSSAFPTEAPVVGPGLVNKL